VLPFDDDDDIGDDNDNLTESTAAAESHVVGLGSPPWASKKSLEYWRDSSGARESVLLTPPTATVASCLPCCL
jgi:hypothetical protein